MTIFKKNLTMAFFTQFISVITSIMISLILPKKLGVNDYAYYQLLIFGSSYIGLLHFGVSDGVYLIYGGKEYDELNHNMLSFFFWIMLVWLILISLVGCGILPFFVKDGMRLYVWHMIFLYGIFANGSWYLGYIFQATNNTRWYSASIFIFKLIVLMLYTRSFIQGEADVKKYVLIYVCAQIVSFVYCVAMGNKVFFGIKTFSKSYFGELIDSCKVGINLTISNVSNALILGIGRIIIDKKWSLESFGKISLAISLTNFLMQFMQQISMVLFPVLRQVSKKIQTELFDALNSTIGILICGLYVFYFPLEVLLNKWLPQYNASFVYLGLLMPICCYDGKVYILYGTFMKVLRKEKIVLSINVLSCVMSFVLSLIFAVVFNNIYAIVMATVFTIGFRNYIFGRVLSDKSQKNLCVFIIETILSILFVLLHTFLSNMIATIIYITLYSVVIWIRREDFFVLKHYI